MHTHEKKIIHGDLKAGNILYDGKTIKLTDFGDSRILGLKIPNLVDVSHSAVFFKDIKGSILWMAPEQIKMKPLGTRTDIWSLGQTLIELATAEHPWSELKDMNDLFNRIEQCIPPAIPAHLSSKAKDFIG